MDPSVSQSQSEEDVWSLYEEMTIDIPEPRAFWLCLPCNKKYGDLFRARGDYVAVGCSRNCWWPPCQAKSREIMERAETEIRDGESG